MSPGCLNLQTPTRTVGHASTWFEGIRLAETPLRLLSDSLRFVAGDRSTKPCFRSFGIQILKTGYNRSRPRKLAPALPWLFSLSAHLNRFYMTPLPSRVRVCRQFPDVPDWPDLSLAFGRIELG